MTRLLASLRIALRALMVNKMRSALTMLGIIIGVSAVIAMVAVGSGAKAKIAEQIASMGSNLLIVLSGSSTSGGLRFGTGTVPTLTVEDAKAILTEIPAVKYVAPSLGGVAQVVFGNQNWSTIVNGTTPEVLEIRDWPLSSGRSFTQQDVDGATKVCLLGQTVVDNLLEELIRSVRSSALRRFLLQCSVCLHQKGNQHGDRIRMTPSSSLLPLLKKGFSECNFQGW